VCFGGESVITENVRDEQRKFIKYNHLVANLLFETRRLFPTASSQGPEHPKVANSLNDLAELYRDVGQYAKGEPLFQRALTIWEKALGPRAPRCGHQPEQLGGALRSPRPIREAPRLRNGYSTCT